MRKIIHVNQHAIRRNAREGSRYPVITIKSAGHTQYVDSVDILGESRVVYRPDKPLSCGARVWIETYADIVTDAGECC